jgi:methylase of polypeptide subunit release factors
VNHEALIDLGRVLLREGYSFVTVTPETHRRANANAEARGRGMARSVRDVLGWSRPFHEDAIPRHVVALLRAADALEARDGMLLARVRFSSIGPRLFVHGAYPTHDPDAVFFGPDTYRFCALIERDGTRARRVVDVGCGSGAGGIVASAAADRVVLADVNDAALAMARVNATLAGLRDVEIVNSDILRSIDGEVDRVLANPPYLVDEGARTYRDGGGDFGAALSLRITREALARLAPGGSLILYTGAAVVDGVDTFRRDVVPIVEGFGASYTYVEIDPDVFGEELATSAYAAVDRIAAVALRATLEGR